jgi:hypothetical protein
MKETMKHEHLLIWLTLIASTLHGRPSHAQATPGGTTPAGGTPGGGTSLQRPPELRRALRRRGCRRAADNQVLTRRTPRRAAPSTPLPMACPPAPSPTRTPICRRARSRATTRVAPPIASTCPRVEALRSCTAIRTARTLFRRRRAASRGARSSPVHVVRRGDTLWDICDRYSFPDGRALGATTRPKPTLIYPGDQIRMDRHAARRQPAGRGSARAPKPNARFVGRQPRVSPNTIFLRRSGVHDDTVKDIWGRLWAARTTSSFDEGDNSVLT